MTTLTPREELEYAEYRLRKALGRIPARARNGSIQDAIGFKKDHAHATRIIGKRGVKLWELTQAANALEKWDE